MYIIPRRPEWSSVCSECSVSYNVFFLLLDLNDASKSRYSTVMSALPVNAEVFGSGNQSEESLLKGR